MFFDSGKVTSSCSKEPPVMTTREELKKEVAREEWKKLISQGWSLIFSIGAIICILLI